MSPTPADLSSTGDLSTTPLPRILVSLLRARFEGALVLEGARCRKRLVFKKGAPVVAESDLASESLGALLVDSGQITRADLARVSEYMQRKGSREGVALLALELLSPKDLFVALKEQLRRRVLEPFGWPDGRYTLELDVEEQPEDIQSFRCDPVALVQEGMETQWSVERMLQQLAPHMDAYPHPAKSYAAIVARLRTNPQTQSLIAALSGAQPLGQCIGSALGSPRALAAACVLDLIGAVRFLDTPAGADVGGADFASEIEIQVADGEAETKSARATGSDPSGASGAPRGGADETRAAKVRAEIEKQHAELAQCDHYTLLGVATDAKTAAIKKAYFKAAKTYHPDSLVRLGLADMKETAARVFARMAEAFEVLSDGDKRRAYDAAQRGELPEVDAKRIAQAETSFRKGEILVRMGDFKGALDYLRPAVDLWPEECAYQSTLGWALYKKSPSEPEAARTHLEKASELDPADSVTQFRLGVVLRTLSEGSGAP